MGVFKQVEFVKDELKDTAGIEDKPSGGIRSFASRISYACSLALKEKEILLFAALQWLSIALVYLFWTQLLQWVPQEVWDEAMEADGVTGADLLLLGWSILCVGLAAFPVGMLTGCMGAAHFLHRQGLQSTVDRCFKLVLPQSWALWSFHWIDGWVTANRLLDRMARKRGESRAVKEVIYYAWKLGISGVLPSIVTGNNLMASCRNSVVFVKDNLVEVAKLRAGYSALCWIVGVVTYAGSILLLVLTDIVPAPQAIFETIYSFYFWAALPLLIALAIVMLVLRPVFVLAMCDLYSDHLEVRGERAALAEQSAGGFSAVLAFAVLCVIVAFLAIFHNEIGVLDWLLAAAEQDR